jgi:hypothetical protein
VTHTHLGPAVAAGVAKGKGKRYEVPDVVAGIGATKHVVEGADRARAAAPARLLQAALPFRVVQRGDDDGRGELPSRRSQAPRAVEVM